MFLFFKVHCAKNSKEFQDLSKKLSDIRKCYIEIENSRGLLEEEYHQRMKTLIHAQRSCHSQMAEIEVRLRSLERRNKLLQQDNDFLTSSYKRLVHAESKSKREYFT
ncbi:hypothetical protein I7I50_09637 [Histoplasma capsulatum G186AR]|uniref:Uncharacterized protein n=1 Tax=Ajellomyces capsulatus TaxID=5037 RepID=A0A8H7YUE8_AJECA|nr:hypothetical protein I7I52_07167 [Histoplasma capsulatum]QSS74451.1 hypothetical protein I7I50_09637 [Histoplasma capsulatum G186AR]